MVESDKTTQEKKNIVASKPNNGMIKSKRQSGEILQHNH